MDVLAGQGYGAVKFRHMIEANVSGPLTESVLQMAVVMPRA